MLTIQVDTLDLYRAMRDLSVATRKDLHTVIRQQAAIMVGQLIATTPPGDFKDAFKSELGITKTDQARGEARIAEEICAVFPTTKIKNEKRILGMIEQGFWWGVGRQRRQIRNYATTLSELAKLHKAARSPSTGRVRKLNSSFMAITTTSARKALIKQQQRKVGSLNAGWLPAASRLKTSRRNVPAWITRHGPQAGGVSEMMTMGGILVTMMNNMPYFPANINARIAAISKRREHGIRKQIQSLLDKRAAKATQQMR